MISPKFPKNERKRQKAVEKYKLLDTPSEDKYDNITSFISDICDAPISLITLLDNDRNFLKSHYGIDFNESPRNISFCGHTINSDAPIMIIEDARKDERFHDNPLVKEFNAIFYAGVSLVNSEGYKLGTLCVYDHKPRTLTLEQKKALQIIAKQVVTLFEQRLQNEQLLKLKENLQRRNDDLEKFAAIVSHDLKSPVNNIISLTELLKTENPDLSKDSMQYIDYLQESSTSLKKYIDGVLSFYRSDKLLGLKKELFTVEEIIKDCKSIVDISKEAEINLTNTTKNIFLNRAALEQVFVNLLTNAIKYNDKTQVIININCNEDDNFYYFSHTDNGRGIPEEDLDNIFDLFKTIAQEDKYGNQGNGIGLATTKKLITALGGTITASSILGKHTTFKFKIEKD
ncbi:sensor histidine kinase [Pontimicrobium sp. MEBiC06410]